MKQTHQPVQLSDDEVDNESTDKPLDFDKMLRFEIGEFGRYQILVAISSGFIAAIVSFVTLNFMFSGTIPDHRCFIPECEPIGSSDFDPIWLNSTIPHVDGRPDPCSRYEYVPPIEMNIAECSAENFNQSNVIRCDKFVVRDNQETLATHLNMLCTGQDQKVKLLGTGGTIGRFIATPITGIISDKVGRLNTIVFSALLGAVFSTLQTLPASLMTFELYWILEFLTSLLSTGALGPGFVYNMEWTTSKYRVRVNNIYMIMLTSIVYGGVCLASWYFDNNFIGFKLALALPAFLTIIPYLILGESPRWLFTKKRYSKAIKSISTACKINGKSIQSQIIHEIANSSTLQCNEKSTNNKSTNVSFSDLFREKILAVRFIVVSLVWLFVFFAYIGIVFRSNKIHSNRYISFLFIGLADIPGNVINTLVMNRLGRKITICSTLVMYALLLMISTQLPTGGIYQLILFFISKTSVVVAMLGLHTYLSEFWPTSIRNTAFSISAGAGRFGSILASMSIILADYYVHLPSILYAAGAIIGCVLILLFLPETMHCEKLPDTIEEALAIGKNDKNRNKKTQK